MPAVFGACFSCENLIKYYSQINPEKAENSVDLFIIGALKIFKYCI